VSFHNRHGIEIINFCGSNEGIALLGTPKDIPDPTVRAQYFPRYRARDWEFRRAAAQPARQAPQARIAGRTAELSDYARR
jgi:hypothetical protein